MADFLFLNKEFIWKELLALSETALNSQYLEMHQVSVSYFHEHSVET